MTNPDQWADIVNCMLSVSDRSL